MKVDNALSFSYSNANSRSNSYTLQDDNAFSFNQSSSQSFYFVDSIDDHLEISEGDYLLAYNNNILVGSRIWNGIHTDIPVMGDDGYNYSAGYCVDGDKPSIKLFKKSTGELIDLNGYVAPFKNNEIRSLTLTYSNYNDNQHVNTFGLIKNYPNPFNPSTTISFNVEKKSHVVLSIYDLAGKLVKELKNENLDPGLYDAHWNGKNQSGIEVSSGTYICKLTSNNISDQMKLLMIK